MNAKTIFTFAGGVVTGLIIGVLLFSGGGSGGPGSPAPVAPPQPQVDRIKLQGEITQLEGMIKEDPQNYQAWKTLGDSYFDIQEPQKSISAYRKALELDDSDPNVWTDLGVMYRRVGDFTKAIEAFDAAIERGPSHTISRLNKGVVYVFDLREYDKGIAAWEDFLRLQPSGPQADQVRQQLEQARSMRGAAETGAGLPPDHPPIEGAGQTEGGGAPPSDPSTYFPKPDQN